jgi:hypothetical protein
MMSFHALGAEHCKQSASYTRLHSQNNMVKSFITNARHHLQLILSSHRLAIEVLRRVDIHHRVVPPSVERQRRL